MEHVWIDLADCARDVLVEAPALEADYENRTARADTRTSPTSATVGR